MDNVEIINKAKVSVSGNAVGSMVINDCIKQYKEIKAGKLLPQLQIIAENEITDFDFSLIGHFILFKEEYPELSITIILQENYEKDADNGIVWKLRQQMVHAYYSSGLGKNVFSDIFTLIDGTGEESMASTDKDKGGRFELSHKFLPIIYLNDINYNNLFNRNRINFVSLSGLELKDRERDENGLYQACRRILFKQITMDNYLQILSQLAFYNSLVEAKMLRYYLYDELDERTKGVLLLSKNKEDFQVGRTQNLQKNRHYREKLEPVFDEIKEASFFRVLLFFTFITSDLIFKEERKLEDEATTIKRLWEFTKDFSYGIDELAKNILEHTDTKKGIIAGFVNNQKFELSIFDYAEKGIMEKFQNYLQRKKENPKNESENNLIQEDIKAINDKNFGFNSFFTSTEYILNEQANRATAHLGLLFFSKLILFRPISLARLRTVTPCKSSF